MGYSRKGVIICLIFFTTLTLCFLFLAIDDIVLLSQEEVTAMVKYKKCENGNTCTIGVEYWDATRKSYSSRYTSGYKYDEIAEITEGSRIAIKIEPLFSSIHISGREKTSVGYNIFAMVFFSCLSLIALEILRNSINNYSGLVTRVLEYLHQLRM